MFDLGDGTSPYDKVGRSFEDWADQQWDVPGIVLVVSIDVDNDVGPLLDRGFQARQKGAGKSLMGALDDVVYSSVSGHLYGRIDAAVIDDQPFHLVDSGQVPGELGQSDPEGVFLIETGNLNHQLGH